jgi:hypothetical protein
MKSKSAGGGIAGTVGWECRAGVADPVGGCEARAESGRGVPGPDMVKDERSLREKSGEKKAQGV